MYRGTDTGNRWFAIVTLLACMLNQTGRGGEPPQDDSDVQYNRDVRPILAEYCFACHGVDSAARKADLRLDKRAEAIDYGALVPGEPEDSELLARILSDDEDLRMPPPETKKKVSAEEIEILRRWIAAGAEYQDHWSFIAPQRPAPPGVQNADWVKNDIDRFVLARLESLGLVPNSEAAPHALFRRLHLDITGLPPAAVDVDAFVADYRRHGDAALSDWIDRLMDTPAWGEHRGRYWLDAARYADTHGLHFDNYREMWPYRDWVIRAFNANQPFDQFVIEQIAGDLLESPTEDQLIATGFQRCNITTNEGGTIAEENLANYAVDRVQTFGWVFLGLTTNCGQCHDHKFDPFTMKDFYSLSAFFRNTTQGAMDGNVKDGLGPVLVIPAEEDRPRWKALDSEIAAAKSNLRQHEQQSRQAAKQWLASLTQEELDQELPVQDLLVHVPLNAGSDAEVKMHVRPTSDDGDDMSLETRPVSATGSVGWIGDGKLGPAPVIAAGSTFDLGDVGDFEQDQAFSVSCWIKPKDKSTAAAIVARMDESAEHRGWDLWQNGGGFSMHIIDTWPGNALKVTTREAVVRPGQWQHVVARYDGSGRIFGMEIFVDGQKQPIRADQKSLQADATIRNSVPLRIGRRSQAGILAGAAIQDVRLYGRELDEREIAVLSRVPDLKQTLATAANERTDGQFSQAYEYYAATRDPERNKLVDRVRALEKEQDKIRQRSAITHIQKERMDSQPMAHILMRGEYDKPTEEVTADVPEALHPLPAGAPRNRLGLAQWLVDPANPLTPRVTVNRFWQQLFGRGIVGTAEDFGVMGELPTHPELLDFLAVDFRENGWDVKRFFKQLLMSATYRQSAVVTEEKLEADPDNSLLARGPRFRMDAEMIRDSALAVSGLLSPKMFGPGVKPYQPEAIWEIVGLPGGNTRNYEQSSGEDLYRRTVYSFWKRMAPPPNMETFNAPSREVCTVRRERTNTPLQALVTLNDPQFVEAARNLATLALQECGGDPRGLVDFVARRVLARSFNEQEQEILLGDHEQYLEYYQAHPDDALALISVGQSELTDKFEPAELAAWTMVCNQVMNLDEALNK